MLGTFKTPDGVLVVSSGRFELSFSAKEKATSFRRTAGENDAGAVIDDGMEPCFRHRRDGEDRTVVESLPIDPQRAVDEDAVAGGVAALS